MITDNDIDTLITVGKNHSRSYGQILVALFSSAKRYKLKGVPCIVISDEACHRIVGFMKAFHTVEQSRWILLAHQDRLRKRLLDEISKQHKTTKPNRRSFYALAISILVLIWVVFLLALKLVR